VVFHESMGEQIRFREAHVPVGNEVAITIASTAAQMNALTKTTAPWQAHKAAGAAREAANRGNLKMAA
jgi:hypothetical protein